MEKAIEVMRKYWVGLVSKIEMQKFRVWQTLGGHGWRSW